MASPADRYTLPTGRVFLSGVQALVRVLLDQHRADQAAGLRTATFVSGYQGSPLSGFDQEVARLRGLAEEHAIVLSPGLNEELGATAVWGTQVAGQLPGPRYDGVLGVWYGKAPGVDRSSDAIRHGNFVGAAPTGGVLALVADDPECKSSTLPSASEKLLASLGVPVLYPGSVQEAVDLGRHAIACSRASGLWTALKVVTSVADATSTADVGWERIVPVIPSLDWAGRPYVHQPNPHLLAPQSLEMERTLTGVRTALAKRYAQVNELNPITHDPAGAQLGIIAAGPTYFDLCQALEDLGLRDFPVRVLKVGMLYPLDELAVRSFADGLEEILVLEEKGPFLEPMVKEALYGQPRAPAVVGEREVRGEPVGPVSSSLDPDLVARILHRWLDGRVELPSIFERIELLDEIAVRVFPPGEQRTPVYCSGCPHNLSTVAPDDAIVGAGIGCHTMVMINSGRRGKITGITQMGGEGAQWIGIAPFVDHDHFIQNLGDGTFYHSGSLAVRAAVAAGLNVTYKLLYNDAVAMTGGQHVVGENGVPALTRMLEAEGVKRIVVTTEETERYAGVKLARIAEVRPRSELARTQNELGEVAGVTVLIHDQGCAAEKRRLRRRGKLAEPPQRVLISERVCEGCGDCAEKSSCVSVEPVDTEFGPKRRIHQSSCNKDFSCLEGDCPSFLTVISPSGDARKHAPGFPAAELPDPELRVPRDDYRVRLVGIGGTGVVTVSQVIGMAAMLEGRHAAGVDQTGLAQKGGPVVSELHISGGRAPQASRPHGGGVDLLLGLDLLGSATAKNLAFAHPGRTVAVVSASVVPTGRMIVDQSARKPNEDILRKTIDASTRASDNVYLDARALAMALFDDHMPANVIALGAAWQRGAVPLSLAAIEEAVRMNGAAADQNLAAFAWGRACVAAPELVESVLSRGVNDSGTDAGLASREEQPLADADRELVERVVSSDGELRRLLEIRVPDLVAYQSRRYAARYVDAVARVVGLERERLGDSTVLAEAVARNLYKLMAYKDEYEVARLQLDTLAELAPGSKVAVHLHPPVLRALGLRRKLKLGRWFFPVLGLLRKGRRLRGTPFDPFGRAAVRRVERALPDEYLSVVDAALEGLSSETSLVALEICELPDLVRGYEEIKMAGVERFRARALELRTELVAGGEPVAV
jgi:indolepyruvate ferredoxin oxidoreductase